MAKLKLAPEQQSVVLRMARRRKMLSRTNESRGCVASVEVGYHGSKVSTVDDYKKQKVLALKNR